MIILCFGWAYRYMRLRDGRRQIISVLLSGDVLSDEGVFGEQHAVSAMTITDAQISRVDAATMRTLLDQPLMRDRLYKAHREQEARALALIANLGCRSAKERIAFTILDVTQRLEERGVVRENRYNFPLLQKDIADLVGITPVHVSRIMGELQGGMINLTDGYLEIVNRAGLEEIGLLS